MTTIVGVATVTLTTAVSVFATACTTAAPPSGRQPASDADVIQTSVPALTRGLADSTFSCGSVATCSGSPPRFNQALCGTVTDASGRAWTVPADVQAGGATCVDVYNDCTGSGANPDYESQLATVSIDESGSEITGWLFGDNFFELYVNGQYVCRDAIGFTPFNSSAARFRAEYPLTVAVRLIDWGTHPGVGLEYERYNVGDGGFIARFSDGSVTGPDWKCQVFYVAPVDDASCVGANRDTSACPVEPGCTSDPESCAALHYEVPAAWMLPGFDDSDWQGASTYPAADVTGTPAYADHAALFGDAEFIWTKSLKLDNQVLCRATFDRPVP